MQLRRTAEYCEPREVGTDKKAAERPEMASLVRVCCRLSGAEAASGQSIVDAHRLASHFIQPAGLIADAH